ncbi:MAG TPA: hypothetical protein VJ547_11890 [Candidatus Thermoplasmatota archaeon]|nr:hypothetical protein [Candidatus Thermoplasmatota archaeon]
MSGNTHPKIIDAGALNGAPISKTTTLDSRAKNGREFFVIHATAGYEAAGAMLRRTDGYFGCVFYQQGARNGRLTKTEAEARALFQMWTAPEEVARG